MSLPKEPCHQPDDTSPQTPLALKRAIKHLIASRAPMPSIYAIARKEGEDTVVVAMAFKDDPCTRLVADGRCYDCYNSHGAYMVKDEIWHMAWPEYRAICKKLQSLFPMKTQLNLCLSCFCLRLGRDLTLDDLTADTINDTIVMGYAMGRSFESTHGNRTNSHY